MFSSSLQTVHHRGIDDEKKYSTQNGTGGPDELIRTCSRTQLIPCSLHIMQLYTISVITKSAQGYGDNLAELKDMGGKIAPQYYLSNFINELELDSSSS